MAKRKTQTELAGKFMCESAVFNGPMCQSQCERCRPKIVEPTLEWFKPYEVRVGKDGKVGIYTRDFNVRLATFNVNTTALQTRLKLLFERANRPAVLKSKRKRKPREKMGEFDAAWGPGSGNW